MSISAIGAAATAVNVKSSAAPASTQRAADGDYKTPGAGRSAVKDSDGDYKPIASAATNTSSATQSAVSSLKLGG